MMLTKIASTRVLLTAGIAMALALAGCGGEDDTASADPPEVQAESTTMPESTTAPETTAETEPAEAPESTEAPEPAPEPEPCDEPMLEGEALGRGSAVAAGCYKVPVLDGATLTTSELLSVGRNHEQMLFVRGESWADAEDRGALFLRTVGIIPPREVGVHQEHHPTVPEVTVDVPTDLTVWFEAVPQAEVIDAVELTVAELPARRWTVRINPDMGPTFDCGSGRSNCIGFVVNEEGGAYVLPAGELANIYQLDAVPDVIGWVFAADEADLAEADTVFADLLAGLDTE